MASKRRVHRDEFKARPRRKRRPIESQQQKHANSLTSAKMEIKIDPKLVISEEESSLSSSVILKHARRSRRATSNLPKSLGVFLLIILPQLFGTFQRSASNQAAEGLQITRFRVPAFVPANLAVDEQQQLAKPILFDCDYDYRPEEDERLIVKWFKDKEAEPFYQWLPELNVRHFADWIRPLLDQSFVSDPHEPLKRYRSLLIRRLSFNLTGSYTCLVSSLGGQDSRQASLVVYQPPRHFAFEHRIFPAPAALLSAALPPARQLPRPQMDPIQQATSAEQLMRPPPPPPPGATRPTQFRGLNPIQQQQISGWPTAAIVRPPNNQQQAGASSTSTSAPQASSSAKIVYTHDGRPIRRKQRAIASPAGEETSAGIASWQLRKKLGAEFANGPPAGAAPIRHKHVLQLHQFQCHASQLTPRPVIMLTVKRDAESIAQYLHESSVINIRPHQVSQRALLDAAAASAPADQLQVTVYDITVSATVALNVSLPDHPATGASSSGQSAFVEEHQLEEAQPAMGVNTILHFRRGQRMSFECHLEITGTEFERRERIFINEQEVYQFAEAEEERRRARLEHQLDPFGNQRQRGAASAPHQPRAGQSAGEPSASQDVGLLASLGLGGSSSAPGQRAHKLLAAPTCWLLALTSGWLVRRALVP